jgi:hypothetical protein
MSWVGGGLLRPSSYDGEHLQAPLAESEVVRFILVTFLCFTPLFLDLQALNCILEEWQCFQPARFEHTDFRPA